MNQNQNLYNDRLSRIVTKAINLSPNARACHDQYFEKEKYYSYATTDSSEELPGFFIVQNDVDVPAIFFGKMKPKVVLNMNYSDDVLISIAHHELVHVQQARQTERNKIKFSKLNDPIDTQLARILTWELHACAYQIEKPLITCMKEMRDGKNDNYQQYKTILSQNNNEFMTHFYSEGFLLGRNTFYNLNQVDKMIHAYKNDHTLQNQDEFDNACKNGRKNLVASLLDSQKCGFVKTYTQGEIQSYSQISDRLFEMKSNMSFIGRSIYNFFDYIIQGNKKITLTDIQDTTNVGNDTFLAKKDWIEVLQAENSTEMIARVLHGTSQEQIYLAVKKQALRKL